MAIVGTSYYKTVTCRNLSSSAKPIDIFKKTRKSVKFIIVIYRLVQRLTLEDSCTKAFYPHFKSVQIIYNY